MQKADGQKVKRWGKVRKKLFSYLDFSKLILFFYLTACVYLTYHAVKLCYYSIDRSFTASIPWFTSVVTAAWGGFATAVDFYMNKSKAENKAKIESNEKSNEVSNEESKEYYP